MNPATLVTPQLINHCKDLQLIFVIGATKTGKVIIAKTLAEALGREILISDAFIQEYGYDNALDRLEHELENRYYSGKKVIIEGILAFRLLRRMARKGWMQPDIIIKTICDDETIKHFYQIEGEGDKIKRALGFNRGLEKIFEEYLELTAGKRTKILGLNTSIYGR